MQRLVFTKNKDSFKRGQIVQPIAIRNNPLGFYAIFFQGTTDALFLYSLDEIYDYTATHCEWLHASLAIADLLEELDIEMQ